jgi:hypothetical protein
MEARHVHPPGVDEQPTTKPGEVPITVSCDDCKLDRSSACDDCVVSFLLDGPTQQAVVVDVMEARALRMLQGAGLVPRLRFERRAG